MNESIYLGCSKCNREEAFKQDEIKVYSKTNPFICIDCNKIPNDNSIGDNTGGLIRDRNEKIKQKESIAFGKDGHDYGLQISERLSDRQYRVRVEARRSYSRRYYEWHKEKIEPKLAPDIIASANAIFRSDEESGLYSNDQTISNKYQSNEHCFNCGLNLKSSDTIKYIQIKMNDKYLLVCKRCNDYYNK
jgi:hypothetical protein